MGRRTASAPRQQATPGLAAAARPRRGPHLGPIDITPSRVTLTVALVGATAFLAYAVSLRDERQVPLLATASAVLGVVLLAIAVTAAAAMVRASHEDRGGRAMGFALGGGIAAILASGSLTAALILAMLWRPG
jgi:hypothetical protein